MRKGALNIKEEARDIVERSRSLNTSIKHYPYTISYGIWDKTTADIGPNPRKNQQARMGNILEYGSMFNAPIPHLQPALDHEAPRFQAALAEAGADIL